MSEYNEIEPVGTLHFSGVHKFNNTDEIAITVSEAYDDTIGKSHVLLTCESPNCGLEFVLSPEKATALAHLLVCAAKAVERNSQLTEQAE